MSKFAYDYEASVSTQLIAQISRYDNRSKRDLLFYRELGFNDLEKRTEKHLIYWKIELRELIFCQEGL